MLSLAQSADNFWELLVQEDEFIAYVAIMAGLIIAVVAIVFTTTKNIVVTKAREATKRELAAYVAEGTLEADKAVAMIEAGKGEDEA